MEHAAMGVAWQKWVWLVSGSCPMIAEYGACWETRGWGGHRIQGSVRCIVGKNDMGRHCGIAVTAPPGGRRSVLAHGVLLKNHAVQSTDTDPAAEERSALALT
ncbi:hypothetical protein JZ751_015470 [Albula glossodonta]|uniref:Uncharacterized protein n=1 Tax=Albula glossodonta TaxID=121402 RepID=A0A8T2N1I9_9TELE|nr:hypothetical protein JZ751_015470 [Albula glossodonta]